MNESCLLVFFFKQKTAYDMRISDWSSDVCSSDLVRTAISSDVGTDATAIFRGLAASISRPDGLSLQQAFAAVTSEAAFAIAAEDRLGTLEPGKWADFILVDRDIFVTPASELPQTRVIETWVRSEERRVGQECVSTFRTWWS